MTNWRVTLRLLQWELLQARRAIKCAWHGISNHVGIRVVIGIFSVALCAMVWLSIVKAKHVERDEAIEHATTEMSNLAIAFEEHTIRTLQGVDAVTLIIARDYARVGEKINLATYVQDGIIDRRLFTSLWIADAAGNLIASSIPFETHNVAQRDGFKVHAARDSHRLYIGLPVASLTTGKLVIPMTRRLNNPDGSFAGIASALVDPSYFAEFYQRANIGRNGLVELVGTDGIARTRRTGDDVAFGVDVSGGTLMAQQRSAPTGVFLSTGKSSGHKRYVSYRTLADYPLIVAVGMSQEEALADQRDLERNYNGAATLATLVIGLFTALLLAAFARQNRLQRLFKRQAQFDTVTKLPNRVLFYDRLSHALAQAKRRSWTTGVMFIDIDRFKTVNDTFGHAAGDELLKQIAARITSCVRSEDSVGRLGGDEFAVILQDLSHQANGSVVAEKLMTSLRKPFLIGGNELFVTASIGVSSCPPDSSDPDVLISNADAAMYDAKKLGKNNCRVYTAAMNDRQRERLVMENALRHAIAENAFELHFQPKASIHTGTMTGCEALLRWHDGERSVSPAEFIPVLEESGLIVPAGEWVLRTACAQIRAWKDAGIAAVPVAVNLSARQFHQQDIADMVAAALAEFAVPAYLLELEITESAAMYDAEATIATLRRLKATGVRVSIDDFGTGYSSLSYLKRFPIDALKIDRSFVKGLPGNQHDASIARAIITMAHALRLKVVAEGVETEAQLSFLAASCCDDMQGYYFARPLTAEACTAMLVERRTLKVPHVMHDYDRALPAMA